MKVKRIGLIGMPLIALLTAFAGALILPSCSGEVNEVSDRMVDLGTHRLHLCRQGKGTPAVIIDVGLGDQAENWAPLRDRIALQALSCTYDRAGYGSSEPGPLPRHSGQVARELKALLEKAQVPGPYVLVGHSLGGLNVQVFAGEFPEDVAGLVLLDPPPLSWIRGERYPELRRMAEEMTRQWRDAAEHGAQSADPQERAQAEFLRMLASEHEQMFTESAELADGISTFGDIPLVVIASGRPNPMFGDVAEEYQRYWTEQSRLLAEKSTNGLFVFAEESSHNLYADEPDLVVDNILSVVSEVRGR